MTIEQLALFLLEFCFGEKPLQPQFVQFEEFVISVGRANMAFVVRA